jgi:hypothetical protein
MHRYGLTYVFYEVLDLVDQIENEVTLTGLDIIMPEIGEVQKVQREVKAAEIEISSKDILSLTKKKISKKKRCKRHPQQKQTQGQGKGQLHHVSCLQNLHKEFHMALALREGQNRVEWDQHQHAMVARSLSLRVRAK